jgi:LysR family hydrogen peroxide-inducible transcriptional activator
MHVRELFKDEFWLVARENDPAAREKEVAMRDVDTGEVLLLEEGHCLRDHAIAACGPRRGAWEAKVEATSLPTLIQMIEGGLGVTLLPEIALKAGVLKGTRLVARPFCAPAPARTIALAARRTSPRRRDLGLLAEFFLEQHRRGAKPGVPALRRTPKS